ncbi:MAG TPA: Gfo/Idh/MocA family oxidoreductase [Spirochaetota bacterium]|nr:Gfo/Idh/MocA family oxidoreductase [Spirochaetota bacterium]
MKQLLPRICFFGCGHIALRHAKMLKKLYPRIQLSFASLEISEAKQLAEKIKGAEYFSSCEEAVSSEFVDIVFITTPHAFHAELAVLAAENKKDIIIEKPVTRTMKELNTIEKAVAKHGVRCTVAENYYYKPIIKKIRKHIESGIIGEPLFFEVNKTNRDKVEGWRTDAEMMGGGALLEGGVHWVNALVSLAGSDPVETIAVKPDITYDTNIPFEDSLMLLVKFRNGTVGKLLHSWRIPNPLKGMALSKIYGTEGVITFESNGLFCSAHGRKKRISFVNPFDFLGFKAMHRAFVQDYIDGRPWEPALGRISQEMKLIHSAYASLKTARFEKI